MQGSLFIFIRRQPCVHEALLHELNSACSLREVVGFVGRKFISMQGSLFNFILLVAYMINAKRQSAEAW